MNYRTRIASIALTILLAACLPIPAHADIITFREGQDLVIDFRESLEFTVDRAHTGSTLGIVVHDLFSANVAGFAEVEPIVGDTALRISRVPIDAVSSSYGEWGHINFEFGAADPRSMYGKFNFGQSHSLKVGSLVSLDAGSVRLPAYFDNPNAVLPDRQPTGVVLTDANQVALSSVTAVPEPTSSLALLVSGIAMLRRRRGSIEV